MTRIEDDEISQLLKGVPSDFRKFKSKWDKTYESKFESFLNQASDQTLEYALKFANYDIEEDGISELSLIESADKSIFLFTLHRFLNDKQLAVVEFADNNGDSIDQSEAYEYVLREILDKNSNIVFHIFLFNEWLDERSKYRYRVKSQLPSDFVDRFEDNSRGIRMTLSRNTRADNFGYSSRNRLDFQESTVFGISRQASDIEKADVTGPQRRRDLRYVFLAVEPNKSLLTICTRSKGIRDELKEKIEDVFSILTTDADIVEDETTISKTKFEEELATFDTDEQDKIKILAVEFRDTNIQPSVPLSVSKSSVGREIRPVVSHLGEEIVDIDLMNIRCFYFNSYGVKVKVDIKENIEQSYLILNSRIHTNSGIKAQNIRDDFHEIFGVPLDKKIPLYWITRARQSLISQMLKGLGYWQTKYIKDEELLELLVDKYEVIDRRGLVRLKCIGCENIYKQDYDEGCPSCGNELEQFDTSFELRPSKQGIRKYLRNKVKSEDLIYYEKLTEKIYGNQFDFLQIGTGSTVIRVLLNTPDVNITPGTIQYLRKSLHPVLVVNPGTVIDKTLLEEVTSEVLDLSEMLDMDLDDNIPADFISTKVDAVLRGSEKHIAAAASDSFEHIQKIIENTEMYRGEKFEQDAFHIINQVVPTIQQWGAKRRGNQPDGFGELFFTKGERNFYRSFAFDSKFTSDNELSIGSKEATTLRDYTLRITKSNEVKRSDTVFQNFIVITNAEPGNFGSVGAAKLNRMRSWKGVPVLMRSDFLLGLHVGYNENIETIKENFHKFNELLYKTFNEDKMYHQDIEEEFFVHLTQENALHLFENFAEEVEGSGLSITELREFLESDIMPA